MKTKKLELDVDHIGGQEQLTKEEEAAICAYIQSRRSSIAKKGRTGVLKKKKELV